MQDARGGCSPYTAASLSDGTHRFAVRATDPAGNSDPTPASRTFRIAPHCTLVRLVIGLGPRPIVICLFEQRAVAASTARERVPALRSAQRHAAAHAAHHPPVATG